MAATFCQFAPGQLRATKVAHHYQCVDNALKTVVSLNI